MSNTNINGNPELNRYQALGEVASLTIQLAKLSEERDIKARLAIQFGATPTELAHAMADHRASVDRRYFATKRYRDKQAAKKAAEPNETKSQGKPQGKS